MNGVVREMRNAYLHEATRNWRAGCIESSKPRFGERRTEKVWQQNLAGRLLYNIVAKASRTVGQTETAPSAGGDNASGQPPSTSSPRKRKTGKVAE